MSDLLIADVLTDVKFKIGKFWTSNVYKKTSIDENHWDNLVILEIAKWKRTVSVLSGEGIY